MKLFLVVALVFCVLGCSAIRQSSSSHHALKKEIRKLNPQMASTFTALISAGTPLDELNAVVDAMEARVTGTKTEDQSKQAVNEESCLAHDASFVTHIATTTASIADTNARIKAAELSAAAYGTESERQFGIAEGLAKDIIAKQGEIDAGDLTRKNAAAKHKQEMEEVDSAVATLKQIITVIEGSTLSEYQGMTSDQVTNKVTLNTATGPVGNYTALLAKLSSQHANTLDNIAPGMAMLIQKTSTTGDVDDLVALINKLITALAEYETAERKDEADSIAAWVTLRASLTNERTDLENQEKAARAAKLTADKNQSDQLILQANLEAHLVLLETQLADQKTSKQANLDSCSSSKAAFDARIASLNSEIAAIEAIRALVQKLWGAEHIVAAVSTVSIAINCVGSWAAQTNTSVFSISQHAMWGGEPCEASNGDIKNNPVDCVGYWEYVGCSDACCDGKVETCASTEAGTYFHGVTAAHGGKECPFTHAHTGSKTCTSECVLAPSAGDPMDWMTMSPVTPFGSGTTLPEETGYFYKGEYQGYKCWWHTKNQAWQRTAATNGWHLMEAHGLTGSSARYQWCSPFSGSPDDISNNIDQWSNGYATETHVGAWGWCGGSNRSSGGWICGKKL